ncbi:hypothetical protein BKI52_42580 [marine bacterium AO1-C]|nr:hypothetical protein BKI52_42580 [marine bacterium AO1-C]
MKTLKEKFGKYTVSVKDLQVIKGGGYPGTHCPDHLRKPGGCEEYWKGDDRAIRLCKCTCRFPNF